MELPSELLAKLQEFSKSGFLLFITNSDGGIDSYMHVDDEASKLGLSSYAQKLLGAQEQLEGQMMMNGLVNELEQEEKAMRKRRKKGGEGQNPA